jgi:WD40 repeat protein
VWDVATGQVVGPFTSPASLIYLTFSPDKQRIASACADGMIRVWNVAIGQAIMGPFTGHTGSILSVAFSPDGQHIASASADRTRFVCGMRQQDRS